MRVKLARSRGDDAWPWKHSLPTSSGEARPVALRQELDIVPQGYEGRTFYVVKDPISLRYYRFDEHDHFLLRHLDGRHTLEEVREAFEQRFRPKHLHLEDLEGFGQLLLKAGLASHDLPQAGQQLYEFRRKRRRGVLLQTLTNILYIEVPLFDPDAALGRLVPALRWLLSPWCLLAGAGFMASTLLLVACHFTAFSDDLPSAQEFFSFKNMMSLWLAIGIAKVLHELGHGIACKALGGEVHDMGALFMCLSPCPT